MKAHIGVDSQSKLIHSVAATAANVHDSQLLGDLLYGEETRVWGDSAYSGQGDTLAECAPRALDFTNRKASGNRPLTDEDRSKKRSKSRVRAKVEHPFLVLKNIFRFRESPIPGAAQECQPLIRGLWAGEYLHGAQRITATDIGNVRLKSVIGTESNQ